MMGFMMQKTRPSRMVMVCCGSCTAHEHIVSTTALVSKSPAPQNMHERCMPTMHANQQDACLMVDTMHPRGEASQKWQESLQVAVGGSHNGTVFHCLPLP